jgi:hypothetical protein
VNTGERRTARARSVRAGPRSGRAGRGRAGRGALALIAALGLLAGGAPLAAQDDAPQGDAARDGMQIGGAMSGTGSGSSATLGESRLALEKWIETQQVIARESKDWQQGREILAGRLELVKGEIATLQAKTREAEAGVAEADARRAELLAGNDELKATGAQLETAVAALEGEVRRLFPALPEPVRERLRPLQERMPADGAAVTVSAAERFQNVLGILNEVNKANSEITVACEVRELDGGRRAEVQVLYVGLAQAFYVSAGGEAGVGRPGPDGWTWEPDGTLAGDVLSALDILQGKHSPAFVPLPVTIR